jgi:hypothetical protein
VPARWPRCWMCSRYRRRARRCYWSRRSPRRWRCSPARRRRPISIRWRVRRSRLRRAPRARSLGRRVARPRLPSQANPAPGRVLQESAPRRLPCCRPQRSRRHRRSRC